MVFRRRHYDKALLVLLSTFMHWQEKDHPMYHTLRQTGCIWWVSCQKLPFLVKSYCRTTESDGAEQISLKAKEIDACKHELHSFKSMVVPPNKFNFSSKTIDNLTVKAAEFITEKVEVLHKNPGQAVLQPRVKGQNKQVTKWKLPNLFGNKFFSNTILPLGYTSVGSPLNPEM